MKKLSFVIQKHNTLRPHFDFRLEIAGVMSSWSIPKGPTLDPKLKRLAMKTEDHDLKYQNFETDTVLIWDKGEYLAEVEISPGNRKIIKDPKEANLIQSEGLKKGEIKFLLNGKRLKGSFALVKTKGFPPGVKNAWLLIKHKDKYCKEGFDAKDFN